RIVRKILGAEGERPGEREPPRPEGEQTLYDVLETDPGSSEEELRRAHRRVREIYAPDSMAVCGLYTPEGLAMVGERIQEAYDTLLDPERRRAYDQKTWPEGAPSRRVGTPIVVVSEGSGVERIAAGIDVSALRPFAPEPAITADTEYTGQLLRQVR